MTTVTALSDFAKRLDQTAEDTEALLAKLLSDTLLPDEIARPKRLMDAMRYSSLGGGKRLRPFLVVESSAVFGVGRQAALLAGAALECIHCYSLIHDDLPAMDNSDLRRGRPTLHKKTDDATAILAGDGLLTLAFDIVTRDEIHNDPTVRLLLTRALARASGIGGMVGGQMLDLAGEGRFGDREPVDVARLQQMKTGALLRYGCIAGAILGQSSPKEYQALDDYGRALGEAFQIADDLLDVEGDAAALGKQTGQDAALGKTTFVTQLGIDGAKQRVRDLLRSLRRLREIRRRQHHRRGPRLHRVQCLHRHRRPSLIQSRRQNQSRLRGARTVDAHGITKIRQVVRSQLDLWRNDDRGLCCELGIVVAHHHHRRRNLLHRLLGQLALGRLELCRGRRHHHRHRPASSTAAAEEYRQGEISVMLSCGFTICWTTLRPISVRPMMAAITTTCAIVDPSAPFFL